MAHVLQQPAPQPDDSKALLTVAVLIVVPAMIYLGVLAAPHVGIHPAPLTPTEQKVVQFEPSTTVPADRLVTVCTNPYVGSAQGPCTSR